MNAWLISESSKPGTHSPPDNVVVFVVVYLFYVHGKQSNVM